MLGALRPGWDGLSTLAHFAELSWALRAADPKTAGPLPRVSTPAFTLHRQLAGSRDPHQIRVLLGTAPDARTVHCSDRTASLVCECGSNPASRTHLSFERPLRPWLAAPLSRGEHRVLLAVLTSTPAT